jgi:molybdenum cofactor biosynthesis protein B
MNMSLNICLLTISDSRTFDDDQSGNFLAKSIEAAGHVLHQRNIVVDNKYQIRALVAAWIADSNVHGIVCTGGTGFTGRDSTPEAVLPLLDKQMPGFGELFRHLSFAQIGTSTVQSRAFAGLANGAFVFCLPGSSNACQLAWQEIIQHQLNSATKPCNLATLNKRLLEH